MDTKKETKIQEIDHRTALSIWKGIKDILNITHGVKHKEVAEDIKNNINFTRHNAWILVFAIILASIGLNTNNKAVIIGAMLVSPLMGPILGLGLSTATNDYPTLFRSLRNLGIAVVLSILTSTIYFLLTPIKEAQSELLSRTEPSLFDVLIALVGGLAGIVAGMKKEKYTNVIPGVSIATALMPPLCTAGYGLATSQYAFFTGAMYLFFINTVFITVSTWIVVRLLNFKSVHAVTAAKDRIWKFNILLLTICVAIPSGWTAIKVVRKSIYSTKAENYISKQFNFTHTKIITREVKFNNTDSSTISLTLYGDILSNETIYERTSPQILKEYGLSRSKINILQGQDQSEDIATAIDDRFEQKFSLDLKNSIIQDIVTKQENVINLKDAVIDSLVSVVSIHEKLEAMIPDIQVAKELSALYDDLELFAYSEERIINSLDSTKSDKEPIPTVKIKWKKDRRTRRRNHDLEGLADYLKIRLNKDTVRIQLLN
jgi:uncharacterized hydrophobic protein (TIGR00271 family)